MIDKEPDLLPKAERVLEVIKDVISRLWAQHRGLHVLVVDNDREDAFEANALCIADRIQALYGGRGSAPANGRPITRAAPED